MTIREIAAKTGFSEAVISVYLTNPETPRLTVEQKRRIDELILPKLKGAIHDERHDRKPNKCVGVILSLHKTLFGDVFYNTVMKGVQEVLAPEGYSLHFAPIFGDNPIDMLRSFIDSGVEHDGYLFIGSPSQTEQMIEQGVQEFFNNKLPFVGIGFLRIDAPFSQVYTDHADSALAIEYLLDMGHRNILLVLGFEQGMFGTLVEDKYREILLQRDFVIPEDYRVYADYDSEKAREVVRAYLEKHPSCTAIHAVSDSMACGCYMAAKDLGLRIPHDISIIGCDNLFYAGMMSPPLTCTDKHPEKIGYEAGTLLLNQMRSASPDPVYEKIEIKTTMVVRKSVRTI